MRTFGAKKWLAEGQCLAAWHGAAHPRAREGVVGAEVVWWGQRRHTVCTRKHDGRLGVEVPYYMRAQARRAIGECSVSKVSGEASAIL